MPKQVVEGIVQRARPRGVSPPGQVAVAGEMLEQFQVGARPGAAFGAIGLVLRGPDELAQTPIQLPANPGDEVVIGRLRTEQSKVDL